jgi:hypothetical protein
VGEPHKGLSYMFQMMNAARIGVGLGAAANASAAYYAALDYAKERPQGRPLSQKDPSRPQVPIVEHADVKRMLLFQRAVVEGSLSLLMQCACYADMAQISSGQEREKYQLLLDLLTPVAKTYPSEMGIHSVSQGLQCFGGYGYCADFPIEQYYRDARIHPIHEGTTGIQGMDLLGRKVVMKNGQALQIYVGEVEKAIAEARAVPELESHARHLAEALGRLKETTLHVGRVAQAEGPEVSLADATLYLEFFGIAAVAWQWLLQGLSAHRAAAGPLSRKEEDFYQGKRHTLRYFYAYELPKIEGLARTLTGTDRVTVEMRTEYFSD